MDLDKADATVRTLDRPVGVEVDKDLGVAKGASTAVADSTPALDLHGRDLCNQLFSV